MAGLSGAAECEPAGGWRIFSVGRRYLWIDRAGWSFHAGCGMSIITGRGDQGQTDLLFGKRIAKTALRMEALGAVDELNAALGMARALERDEAMVALIDGVQERLVGLMGQLACLNEDAGRYGKAGFAELRPEDLAWVEGCAREHEARGIRFTGWARPGAEGSAARAAMDVARAVARRAERRVWELHESGEDVPEVVRLFFNRLSDFLWILARSDRGGGAGDAPP